MPWTHHTWDITFLGAVRAAWPTNPSPRAVQEQVSILALQDHTESLAHLSSLSSLNTWSWKSPLCPSFLLPLFHVPQPRAHSHFSPPAPLSPGLFPWACGKERSTSYILHITKELRSHRNKKEETAIKGLSHTVPCLQLLTWVIFLDLTLWGKYQ